MSLVLPLAFDTREGFIFHNGAYKPWKDARIHILTHALHYGSSCFEGIRIYEGKIFKNREHAGRMIESAKALELNLPFTAYEIEQICIETCKVNNVKDGYIRPLCWRGSNQMQVSAQHSDIHFSVSTWEWANKIETLRRGQRLIVGKYKRPSPECGPVHAKAGGLYVSSTLVKHDAENKGFNDALMLDFRDYIAECTTSNFFAVFDDEIHTPTPDCFLNGITRQTIIHIAKTLGYKVVERNIKLGELREARDAFSTGTAAEISKISSVSERDLKAVYELKDTDVSDRLLKAFHEFVRSS